MHSRQIFLVVWARVCREFDVVKAATSVDPLHRSLHTTLMDVGAMGFVVGHCGSMSSVGAPLPAGYVGSCGGVAACCCCLANANIE